MQCANCQAPAQPTAKFCSHCGSPLASEGKDQQGENKFMTVVFSDVTSYTTISEHLDPEEVQQLLTDIHACVHKLVPQYGGIVHEIIGDCVVLLFGEPQAKEDDAIRAVKAVRQLHLAVSELSSPVFESLLGAPLSMHSGIHTGRVLVTQDTLRGLRQIVGDTVNTAARLDGIAQADQIVVSRSTYELCRDHFEFETLQPVLLKGKKGLQEVYLCLDERSLQEERVDTLQTGKLIGRQVEMDQFGSALDSMSKESCLITVTAEAGGGKSRLVREWLRTFKGEVSFYVSRCTSMMVHSRYGMWAEAISVLMGIEVDAALETKSEVIQGFLSQHGFDQSYAKYIHNVLQLDHPELADEDSIVLKKGTTQAIVSMVNYMADQGPACFIFEDLHWADQLSLELLDEVVNATMAKVLWVCTYRSSFSWPSLSKFRGSELLRHRPLHIQPLSRDNGEALLQSLLQTSEVPAQLSQYIHNKVQGNPFYIEEFVRSLIESNQLVRNGVWKLTTDLDQQKVPTSIHGIVRSRLDRLESPDKRLLQQASVIGRSFPYHVIERITDEGPVVRGQLEKLQDSEILSQQRLEEKEEYSFRHALMQEITYDSMLKKDRREIHHRVGCIMEDLFAERLIEFHEVLAHHFSEGRDVKKAVKYLVLAGRQKCQDLATEEADKLFQKAYDILIEAKDLPEDISDQLMLDVLIGWSFVYYHQARSKDQYELLGRYQYVADRCQDIQRKAWFYGWLGNSDASGNLGAQGGMKFAQYAIDLAEQVDESRLKGYVYAWYATGAFCVEGTAKGEKYAIEAVHISRQFPGDHYLAAKSRLGATWCLLLNGKFQSARRYADECIELGEELSSPRMVSLGNLGLAMLKLAQGQMQHCIDRYLLSGRAAEDALYRALGLSQGAAMLALMRRDGEAKDVLKEVPIHNAEVGFLFQRLADASFLLNTGNMRKGFSQLEAELDQLNNNGSAGTYALLKYTMGVNFIQILEEKIVPPAMHIIKNIGFVASFMPRLPKRTLDLFSELIEHCREHDFPGIEAMAYYHAARLQSVRGKKRLARDTFIQAIAAMEKLEMPDELASARNALTSIDGNGKTKGK